MANYSTTANVVLSVNGKQAQQMLSNLQKEAQSLERKLAKAASAGDKATMKKLQRELSSTNKMMQQLQGSTATIEQVLARLDKATPRELHKTLRTLQQQMNGIQRGSKAWDAHIAKIKVVKAEMAKLNASLVTQKSLWERMNIWLNNCQTALLGLGAAVAGLIMAARKAVNAFAEMDEQLANTRKYTGMCEQDVRKLNDAFLSMDSRTPRARLNELAQEAGRLGKNTLESVQGYVEAADIINVALVDLGEGATQTIAKLTNIFGVEKLLGTRDAMLAVGSTVNVLSQNCTASKPYLVEFAQRMAGIGSQAGLTIPQILAFGAVLDANGQKVEMSATAIQKVIMNLANKNHEFAKTLGLDADLLNKTLKNSAKDGLLMFLDALHALGEKSSFTNATMILAPAFKDMGLDAARVSQVLSTLAKHIDEVKWQMGEADKAFREASSATREYEIFNNTAQASIDKAKKRVNELAIQLGEKLYPIMKHIYTSSGVFLRVLNTMVDFVIRNKTAIVTLAVALTAYNVIMLVYNTRTAIATKATALFNGALKLAHGIVPALNLIMSGLTNTVQYFTNGLNVNYAMQQRWRKSMEVMKFSSWVGLILAVAAAIYTLSNRISESEKATREFAKKMDDAKNKAHGFNEEAMKEQHELDVLFGKLEATTKGTDDYNKIKDQLIKQYGKYLKGLINEKGEIINLTSAYNRLAVAVRRAAQERGIAAAEEQINNDYYKESNGLLEQLQSSLEKYGASAKDAARIVQSVGSAMASGKAVSPNIVNEINRYAANTPGGMSWGQMMHYRADRTSGVAGWLNQGIADLFTLGSGRNDVPVDPASVVNSLYNRTSQRKNALSNLDLMHDGINPMRHVNDSEILWAIESLQKIVEGGKGGSALVHGEGNVFSYMNVTLDKAKELLSQYQEELYIRGGSAKAPDGEIIDTDSGGNNGASPISDKERIAAERAAQQALKADLKEQKRLRDEALAENECQRGEDIISYSDYLNKKDEIELAYIAESKKVLEKRGLQQTAEYAALVKRQEEITNASLERMKSTELAKLKQLYTADSTENAGKYHDQSNEYNYADYISRKEELDLKYLNDRKAVYERYRRTDLQEYAQLLAEEEPLLQKQEERKQQLKRRQIDIIHKEKLNDVESDFYTPGSDTFMRQTEYEQKVFEELVRYLQQKRGTFLKGSEEWQRLDDQINDATSNLATNKKREYADTYKKLMSDEVRKGEYDNQLQMMTSVYQNELALAEGNEQRKLALTRAYNIARLALAKEYGVMEGNEYKKAIAKSAEWLNSDGGKAMTGAMETLSSGMSEIFSGVTSLMQADLDIQTASINKRYDAEISRAEGNSYQVKKLEQQKEKEIAKAKNEANKKMFAMQVIQAVAQTATNALSAYGSAAAVPVIGYILAPIAAAMAVAAGAIQIASIKKQQQASEAQGYSQGGFTPDGDKDKPVGIVHAGEWVASQKLTRSPQTRPLLNALEYAQRNNTIGSITASDVSRSLTAPMLMAAQPQQAVAPVVNVNVPQQNSDNTEMHATLKKLNDRLNEPFVTVNTVSGDLGIQKAQQDYELLMKNKSPKSRR